MTTKISSIVICSAKYVGLLIEAFKAPLAPSGYVHHIIGEQHPEHYIQKTSRSAHIAGLSGCASYLRYVVYRLQEHPIHSLVQC